MNATTRERVNRRASLRRDCAAVIAQGDSAELPPSPLGSFRQRLVQPGRSAHQPVLQRGDRCAMRPVNGLVAEHGCVECPPAGEVAVRGSAQVARVAIDAPLQVLEQPARPKRLNAWELWPRCSIPMRYVRPPTVMAPGTLGSSRIGLATLSSSRGTAAAAVDGSAAPSVSATAAIGAARRWRRSVTRCSTAGSQGGSSGGDVVVIALVLADWGEAAMSMA